MGTAERDQRRLYGDLAWTWPVLSSPEHYVEEAREAQRLIEGAARVPPETLLHLGCGGGHLDWTLKKRFRITGVDTSERMLALARRLNPDVPYVLGDMRTVRFRRRFDAVAVFDSIGYMLAADDLRATFATAYAHLRPGGVFLTYAEETVERFRQNRTHTSVGSRDDVRIVLVENAFDPDPDDTTFESTFVYMIRRRRDLDVQTDRHLLGLFPFRTWLDLLGDAGFDVRCVEPGPAAREGEGFPWFLCVKPAR